jgi:hypothetical protein
MGQRQANRPPIIESRNETAICKSVLFGPCGKRLSFAVKLYHSVIALIAALSFSVRPADISGSIVSVYVNSVQGETRRTGAKNGFEGFKRFQFWRNKDTSSAIIFVISGFRIPATMHHA